MMTQDPLAWVLGLAGLLLGLVFCLLVFTLILRVTAAREQRRRESVRRTWQPILFDSLYTDSLPESLPLLEKRSVPAFSELWCSLLESVSGSARQRMTEVGRQLELADRIAPLMRHRRFSYRLLAITVQGYQGGPGVRGRLQRVIDWESSPVLALAALQALMHVDEKAGWYWLFAGREHHHWSAERLVAMLAQTDRARARKELIRALRRQSPDTMPFVLQLMAGLRLELPGDALRSLAASPEGQHPDVLSQLLSLAQQPDQHGWVVTQLHHESPQVRVQAARALLRLGRREDLDRLMPLLCDQVWWVRYRAMQAILALPEVDLEQVRALVEELADPFARDIFQHVERESSWGYRGEHGYLAH